MVKTWVVVHLVDCGLNVAIPMKYIFTFRRWAAYNRRINRNQLYLIFYSKNFDRNPNFHLEKRNTFSAEIDGCYLAKLLRCFGKYITSNMFVLKCFSNLQFYFEGSYNDAKLYIERNRPIPPATYNTLRLKERPIPLLSPNSNSNGVQLNRTLPLVRLNRLTFDANLQSAGSTSSSMQLAHSSDVNVSSSSAVQMMSPIHDRSGIDSQNMSHTIQNSSVNSVNSQNDLQISSSSIDNTCQSQSIPIVPANALRDITNYPDDEIEDDTLLQFDDIDTNDSNNAIFDDDVMIQFFHIFL